MIFAALAARTLLAACPAEAVCTERDGVLSVAATQARAEAVLVTALDARERFTAVFERAPGRTAIIEDMPRFPGFGAELRADGWIVKPWISPDAMRETLAAQMRPALRQAMPDASEAEIEARITPVLDQRVGRDEKVRHAEAIIAHELGHLWFIDVFDWPQSETGERAYGAAAAPDWLDETAAVILESDALTEERRAALCARLPEDPAAEYQRFFTIDHPLISLARRAAESAEAAGGVSGEPRIMVMDSQALGAGDALMSDAGYFYALSRNLVDWTLDEAEAALFPAMAAHVARGGDPASFLAGDGPAYGAPETLEAWSEALGAYAAARCETP
ncbi:MAG: hypothetical protein ABL308_01855 [Oceanicaulis sp.]